MGSVRRSSIVLLGAALCGCFKVQMRALDIEAQAPVIDLPSDGRRPLKIAVVIPDPMGLRVARLVPESHGVYGVGAKPAHLVDETQTYRGDEGFPIGRELARLCSEAFPQAFDSAVVLRDIPAPGQYDLVVQAAVTQVTQSVVVRGIVATETPSYDWKLAILDRENVEAFSKNGTAVGKGFHYGLSPAGSMKRMGRAAAEASTAIVKEWVELVYAQAPALAGRR